MSQHPWNTLGAPTATAPAESPTGEFAFLTDPLALLTDDQQRELREDLADLTRLRREAESEGSSLRMA